MLTRRSFAKLCPQNDHHTSKTPSGSDTMITFSLAPHFLNSPSDQHFYVPDKTSVACGKKRGCPWKHYPIELRDYMCRRKNQVTTFELFEQSEFSNGVTALIFTGTL